NNPSIQREVLANSLLFPNAGKTQDKDKDHPAKKVANISAISYSDNTWLHDTKYEKPQNEKTQKKQDKHSFDDMATRVMHKNITTLFNSASENIKPANNVPRKK